MKVQIILLSMQQSMKSSQEFLLIKNVEHMGDEITK